MAALRSRNGARPFFKFGPDGETTNSVTAVARTNAVHQRAAATTTHELIL